MQFTDIQKAVRMLFLQTHTAIPKDRMDMLLELNDAGEPGVALEDFCTNLVDFDCHISSMARLEIERLGREMGLNEAAWKDVKSK